MTTTTNAENSFLSPTMFNIQYPNSNRGMFSLRQPFKDMTTAIIPTEERQASTRKLTPAVVQPINTDPEPPIQERPVEPAPVLSRQRSKRNAEVQCSLLTPINHHDMGVQTKFDRQRVAPVNQVYDDYDDEEEEIVPPPPPPRYHRQKRIQPIEQRPKVYEIWDVESARLQPIPVNQTIRRREIPRTKYVRNRRPIVEYPDEEEEFDSNYDDERIVYARQPRKPAKKTYLPPNVRMICVRDDTNRASY